MNAIKPSRPGKAASTAGAKQSVVTTAAPISTRALTACEIPQPAAAQTTPEALRSDTTIARGLLQAFTPGGLEEAFRSLSEPAAFDGLPPAPEGPPSPEAVEAMTATFADHGVEFTGPPLAALLAAG